MRTLLTLELRDAANAEETVLDWLTRARFRPVPFPAISDKEFLFKLLQATEAPNFDEEELSILGIARDHCYRILTSIPGEEEERRNAFTTARYIVTERWHSIEIWGMVCVNHTSVTIRWRQGNVTALERATENTVKAAWKEMSSDGIFLPFAPAEVISVKEPNHTSAAYAGVIIPPKYRARWKKLVSDKDMELWLALLAHAFALLGLILSYHLEIAAGGNPKIAWWGSFFDRVSTTLLMTGMITALNIFFYLKDMDRKFPIDWRYESVHR
jgi:hypothetical protein